MVAKCHNKTFEVVAKRSLGEAIRIHYQDGCLCKLDQEARQTIESQRY